MRERDALGGEGGGDHEGMRLEGLERARCVGDGRERSSSEPVVALVETPRSAIGRCGGAVLEGHGRLTTCRVERLTDLYAVGSAS